MSAAGLNWTWYSGPRPLKTTLGKTCNSSSESERKRDSTLISRLSSGTHDIVTASMAYSLGGLVITTIIYGPLTRKHNKGNVCELGRQASDRSYPCVIRNPSSTPAQSDPRELFPLHMLCRSHCFRGSRAGAPQSNDELENVHCNSRLDTLFHEYNAGVGNLQTRTYLSSCIQQGTNLPLAHAVKTASTIDVENMPTKNNHPTTGTACRSSVLHVCHGYFVTMLTLLYSRPDH